jgi:hypothetical protein
MGYRSRHDDVSIIFVAVTVPVFANRLPGVMNA